MEEMEVLITRQQNLLQAWLDEHDGEARFVILKQLREVEGAIEKRARKEHIPTEQIHTYVIRPQ